MFIMLISPIIGGCSLGSCFQTLKLSTPEITLHSSSKCLSWSSVESATSYDVYCNDELVDEVPKDKDLSSYVYDFSLVVGDSGEYEFYIIATANFSVNEPSDKSNTVTYISGESSPPPSAIYDTTIQTSSTNNQQIGFAINGTDIQFIPFSDSEWEVDGYELYLYSNTSGLNTYPISLTKPVGTIGENINLLSSQFNLKDEIYAVRMGVVVGEEHYVCSEMKFINPDKCAPYSDDIYIFDGIINDCYIETIEELRNVVYYGFVNKISAQNIKLSPAMAELISSYSSKSGDMASKLQTAVAECFNYFFETRDEYSLVVSTLNSASYQFCIKVGYQDSGLLNSEGNAEPDTGLVPPAYAYEDIEWDTYYDTCGYTMRNQDSKYSTSNYDNFASDKHFLYTTVSTSEQLYWAVENKITPVCKSGSTAATIYSTAKSVLNSIISDQMTDYEKVLSIFDWICDNTSYDYYSLINGCYENAAGTITPVYYLEGVFSTGYAVCDGFSKAFSLLCNMEGIECIRIVGYAGVGSNKGGHAWNKVLLDLDPSDSIGPEYYVVDITWTELKGSTYFEAGSTQGEEVTSHEYFLVNDSYIESTHEAYARREKFSYYVSTSNFDYYDGTEFTFNGEDYGLITNSEDHLYDFKVDSDEEMEAVFYYMFVENRESVEVLITYDYIVDVTSRSSKSDWYDALIERMRKEKFNEQYIFINTSGVLNKNTGIILVLENNLLIDDNNEVGHLMEFMSHYEVYGTYELYVTQEMLSLAEGNTELDRVNNMFGTIVAQKGNINVEFVYHNATLNGTEVQYYYTMEVTPKTAA